MERLSSALVSELRTFSQHLADQIESLAEATGSLNTETQSFGRNIEGMESSIVQLLKSSVNELSSLNVDLSRSPAGCLSNR